MRTRVLLLAATLLAAVASGATESDTFDVLIRNGRVIDGTGNPWVRADIGIREGHIAGIGKLEGSAARVIDAGDRVVAPGFIDAHSHAADSLTRESLRAAAPLIAQGVTTIVVNPDGGGPIDLAEQGSRLEAGGVGVNVAQLIGHGSLRLEVMGEQPRAPTAAELDRMRELVRRAMDEGAFGLSSGLFYIPGRFATTEEVVALARIAAERGGVYASHLRDEADYNVGVVAALEEFMQITERARLRGIVTHMKVLGPDNWGKARALVERIDAARARGVEIFADQYPWDASSTTLGAALLPDGPTGTPAEDAKTATDNLRRRGGPASIRIAFHAADRSLEGKSLEEIARARHVTPVAAALDIVARGNASIVSHNMSEEDIETIMRQPYTMTSSDGDLVEPGAGVPHPRNNGSHARKLARYVRERGTIGLEFAIRAATSLPALVFGLKDRGTIREGAWADLVILDPDLVQDRATYADPHQLATGAAYVFVNGVMAMDEGRLTGARAGKVLRRE
jgi:N-acyl-D-amino-acid deacylase